MASNKLTKVNKNLPAPLEDWEQQEAAHARDVRSKETLGAQRITHRGGNFKVDETVVGKSIKLVVLDWRFEKSYFEGAFDPNTPTTPDCYAFGTDEKSMKPHEAAPDKQNPECTGCKHNAFNTANVGRGKRCKDYRKLLVISPVIGQDGKPRVDPDAVQKAEKRTLQVPPVSLKNFANYLTSLKPIEEGGMGTTRTGSASEVITQMDTYDLDSGGHGIKFSVAGVLDKEAFRAVVAARQGSGDMLTAAYPVIEAEKAKAPQRDRKSNRKLD